MNRKAWLVILGFFLAAGLIIHGLGLVPYWWVFLLTMMAGYGVAMWSAAKNTPIVHFQVSFIVGTVSLIMLLMSWVVGAIHTIIGGF